MGKHSKEKSKIKINYKKELIAVFIIIALVFGINYVLSYRNTQEEKKDNDINNSKTIEGERLVIKSNFDYNKVVEFMFENNIVKTIKIYEQYETKEEYEEKKAGYELLENIQILDTNDNELSIEIEKKDFGSDTGLSYEEIYNKYIVQIIGGYSIIQ